MDITFNPPLITGYQLFSESSPKWRVYEETINLEGFTADVEAYQFPYMNTANIYLSFNPQNYES
jgi:hypothetical protein